jgi:hypothetical protein
MARTKQQPTARKHTGGLRLEGRPRPQLATKLNTARKSTKAEKNNEEGGAPKAQKAKRRYR